MLPGPSGHRLQYNYFGNQDFGLSTDELFGSLSVKINCHLAVKKIPSCCLFSQINKLSFVGCKVLLEKWFDCPAFSEDYDSVTCNKQLLSARLRVRMGHVFAYICILDAFWISELHRAVKLSGACQCAISLMDSSIATLLWGSGFVKPLAIWFVRPFNLIAGVLGG